MGGGVISKGFIAMFDGAFQNGYPIDETTGLPDTHWHICDGTNGTPDLRDRFIVGSGSSYKVGDKGGEAKHKLAVNELPERTIVSFKNTSGKDITFQQIRGWDTELGTIVNNGWGDCNIYDAKNNVTPPLTSGNLWQPHENRPPYYALAFIKKIR